MSKYVCMYACITVHIHKLCAHYPPFSSSFPFFLFMLFVHVKMEYGMKVQSGFSWKMVRSLLVYIVIKLKNVPRSWQFFDQLKNYESKRLYVLRVGLQGTVIL